jgi:hypothetical protein
MEIRLAVVALPNNRESLIKLLFRQRRERMNPLTTSNAEGSLDAPPGFKGKP